MSDALAGLVAAGVAVLGGLIVALGRFLTAYLKVREQRMLRMLGMRGARLERMLNRRGFESTPPPTDDPPRVERRRKRRTLAEKVFLSRMPTELPFRVARDTAPDDAVHRDTARDDSRDDGDGADGK